MQLHQLKPIHKAKKKKRIGRGGKRGTYSGRGMKGQKSRAGARMQPMIRELIKRYPKLRGYKFSAQGTRPAIINIGTIEKIFCAGESISPKILLEKKLIRKVKGRIPDVKILGKGLLEKAVKVEKCEVSNSAKEKIEKAGGTVSIKHKTS